jgi:hypothetical protein
MAASHSTLHALDPDPHLDAHDPDTEPPTSRSEPVSPAEAQRRQIWTLAPAPPTLTTILGGVAAILFGGAIGFWLGRRTAPRPARPVRHAAATFESVAELAPVALNLLKNPLIRTMAVRILVRQLSKRIAS